MAEIKTISPKEFREKGFLQELNRRFLHPLGMALEITVDDDGSEQLGRIWDYRDDPEGMIFGDKMLDSKKSDHVARLLAEKADVRLRKFGYIVQPAPKL